MLLHEVMIKKKTYWPISHGLICTIMISNAASRTAFVLLISITDGLSSRKEQKAHKAQYTWQSIYRAACPHVLPHGLHLVLYV